MRAVLLGLAIHNLPLIRQLFGSEVEVAAARVLLPFGYVLTLAAGERSAQLSAYMPGLWAPEWTLEAWGRNTEITVEFPPSYVLAGSARATFRNGESQTVWRFAENGYQAEWRHVADVALGAASLAIRLEDVVEDLLFALKIADRAAELMFA
jgi:predicted dehydrogenase